MVVLLSHFPGKKLLLVGSIFMLRDILRIPLWLTFRTELLFPLTCGNLVLEGLQNYSDKPFSRAGPMSTSARGSVFKIKTNVKYNPKGGSWVEPNNIS